LELRDIFLLSGFYPQDANPEMIRNTNREVLMRMQSQILKSICRKTIIAAVVLGGFLGFVGASSASARTVFVERPRVIVRGGFYSPRFYAPRERVIIVPHRYWDVRFHCWRYR
jgi:hypothetical protein